MDTMIRLPNTASDAIQANRTLHPSEIGFADQIVVHFACQITLCQKREQGCEGIAPPTCYPIDFPPIQTIYKRLHTTHSPRTTVLERNHYGVDVEDKEDIYDMVSARLHTTTSSSTP
ncbi:hypothetical protein TELCIR_17920, partial [Teladorsagia circumcincta]